MLDALLHTGLEHPSVLWMLVSSLLSFAAGLGLGIRSDRLEGWLGSRNAGATDNP